MSNLDRSLDEIISSKPRNSRRGGRGGPRNSTGGVQKRTSPRNEQRQAVAQKSAAVAAQTIKPASGRDNGSKILVSNLPYDVTETQIKEYFAKQVGPIKRAQLQYGPNGTSRGVATIYFVRPKDAQVACNKYNGVPVDGRSMTVELIAEAPALPTFAERIGAPNKPVATRGNAGAKPKSAVNNNSKDNTRGNTERGGRGRRGGARGTRGRKPKSKDELDAEMTDYFQKPGGAGAAAAPAASTAVATVPTTNGTAATSNGNMEFDEIM